MAECVELPIDDDQTIRVEVSAQGLSRVGAGDVVARATERFEDAIERIVRLGERTVLRAREVGESPDAIEVVLGLKLTAKTGFVVAESTGEANFQVTLKWARKPSQPEKG